MVFQRDITRLMVKHMNLDFKGNEQGDKLRLIEAEVSCIQKKKSGTKFIPDTFHQLMEQYPEVFAAEESKKRLYFATRFVMHMHSGRRCHSNRRHVVPPSPPAPTQSSPIITSTHDREENQQSEVATRDPAPESASSQIPSRSNESSMGVNPDITHDPNQYKDVHRFLEASTPPMTHLMDAFINFGCINADFLRAISVWSLDKIRNVLDQLSLGPNGRQISRMDKFVLENHFKEYFTQLEKRGN